MMEEGQLGEPVPDWQPPPRPGHEPLEGPRVRLEPLAADAHAADLHRAYAGHDILWKYLSYGPFESAGDYKSWLKEREAAADPRFFVLRDRASGHCGGIASFLRIDPPNGSIEVGHICIAPELQRGAAFTEAMWLMMKWAFDSGYRRYEWKCHALNLASRRAAQRLGFSYEGVFRQATINKARNRDTAWFAAIDKEWPALDTAFRRWLDPANFDAAGHQRERLSDLTGAIRANSDPALD